MSKPWTVYALSDPRDGAIGYVGLTTKHIQQRLGEHMSLSKSGNTKKDAWLRLLSKEKVYPECSKLESGTDATEGKIAEAKHIRRLKSLGEPLTNYQHAGSSLNSYYIRFPDDLESQVEEEKRRVEDSSGVETKMVNVIASLVKRGLTSLARSRKRKGGKS